MNDDLKRYNPINIYQYGSYVYGTNDSYSDMDYVIITDNSGMKPKHNDNYIIRLKEQFQFDLDNQKIHALECFFLDEKFKYKEEYKNFRYTLDKYKLRDEISTVSSNSWVKAKKKLKEEEPTYENFRLSIKSAFHAIRIIDFGIQIALTGKINDYSSMNFVLEDLRQIHHKYPYDILWNVIEIKYRKLYNTKKTEFRRLCPKKTSKEKYYNLKNTLYKYNCYSENLYEDLKQIIDDNGK